MSWAAKLASALERVPKYTPIRLEMVAVMDVTRVWRLFKMEDRLELAAASLMAHVQDPT